MVSAAKNIEPVKNLHRDLLAYTYENCLTEETQPNQDGVYHIQNQYGYAALAYRADDMARIPKTARSLESMFYKIEKEGFRYIRPNLSYTSKSFKKKKIRWMVGFFFDFDKEQLEKLGIRSWQQLVLHVESKGFPVCAVVKSSTGYHVWCPMKPLRGTWNGEEKTIQRYDAVMKAMAKVIGSDPRAASAEHYFRAPNNDNLVYFRAVEKEDFTYYENLVAPLLVVPDFKPSTAPAKTLTGFYMGQRGIKAILEGNIKTGTVDGKSVGRNNAALTLAIALKKDGYSQKEALDVLHDWWSNNISQYDFDFAEVEKCVRSAYANNYGVSGFYVEALSGYKLHRITKRKVRGTRQHHFSEIEQDVITYLREYFLKNGEHLTGVSNEKLAALISVHTVKPISKSSLEKVIRGLKEKGKLDVQKIRQGRSFVSKYVLDSSLLAAEQPVEKQPVKKAEVVKIQDLRTNSHRQPERTFFCAIGTGVTRTNSYSTTEKANISKIETVVSLFGMLKTDDSEELFPVGGVKNPFVASDCSIGGVNGEELFSFFDDMISDAQNEVASGIDFWVGTILDDDECDK